MFNIPRTSLLCQRARIEKSPVVRFSESGSSLDYVCPVRASRWVRYVNPSEYAFEQPVAYYSQGQVHSHQSFTQVPQRKCVYSISQHFTRVLPRLPDRTLINFYEYWLGSGRWLRESQGADELESNWFDSR